MASNKFKIEINTKEFKRQFGKNGMNALHEIGKRLVEKVKENAPVDEGDLKESIGYKTNFGSKRVVIGSSSFYARWVELGTGIYYEKTGKGRNTPWYFETPSGKIIRTVGIKAKPFIRPAINENVDEIERIVAEELGRDL